VVGVFRGGRIVVLVGLVGLKTNWRSEGVGKEGLTMHLARRLGCLLSWHGEALVGVYISGVCIQDNSKNHVVCSWLRGFQIIFQSRVILICAQHITMFIAAVRAPSSDNVLLFLSIQSQVMYNLHV
jgi:hypothetical protein